MGKTRDLFEKIRVSRGSMGPHSRTQLSDYPPTPGSAANTSLLALLGFSHAWGQTSHNCQLSRLSLAPGWCYTACYSEWVSLHSCQARRPTSSVEVKVHYALIETWWHTSEESWGPPVPARGKSLSRVKVWEPLKERLFLSSPERVLSVY